MTIARELLDGASAPYRAAGRFAYHFARAKLAHDPVFEAILAHGLLARRTRILDLGCGQGLLAALLLAARAASDAGAWPAHWPPPRQASVVRGIELIDRSVRRAQRALGCRAEFVAGDVRRMDFGSADGIVILDVLHYLEYAEQRAILQRAHRALLGEGVLLLRVGDAAGGVGFALGKFVDRMTLLAAGSGIKRLYCRSASEWRTLLSATGFDTEFIPMSAGTPFANMLIVAKPA
jgi:SAM-dependent methyltransferase